MYIRVLLQCQKNNKKKLLQRHLEELWNGRERIEYVDSCNLLQCPLEEWGINSSCNLLRCPLEEWGINSSCNLLQRPLEECCINSSCDLLRINSSCNGRRASHWAACDWQERVVYVQEEKLLETLPAFHLYQLLGEVIIVQSND